MRIFCDGAVNKEPNRLEIGCIAYSIEGHTLSKILEWHILSKISKCKVENSSLMTEVLALEKAMYLTL